MASLVEFLQFMPPDLAEWRSYEYKNEIDDGVYTGILHHDVSYDQYSYVVIGQDIKRIFFYDGICQRITKWETYTTDEYGHTVTGKLTLEDGTVVLVDINNPY